MMNPVQTKGIMNIRYSSGTCYVIIPGGVDRDMYVQNCYRRGTVAVQFENGSGFMLDVNVGLSILKDIDFPEGTGELGSQLIYVTHPLHNKPIIIDRILKDDEATNLRENEFRLEKYTDGGSVSVSGVAENGNLFVNVEGTNQNGGKVYVDVSAPDDGAEVVVNVKGDIRTEVRNIVMNILQEMNISSKSGISIGSGSSINIVPGERVNLGEGSEPLVLGDTMQSEITKTNNLLQAIVNIINGPQIPEPGNGSPSAFQIALNTAIQPLNLGDFTNIKSETSFTD